MPRFKNLVGMTFGRWTVLERVPRPVGRKSPSPFWRCRCSCGVVKIVVGDGLNSGVSRSCGCLRADVTTVRNITHGKSRTSEHNVWKSMSGRCKTPTCAGYRNYGARGISVCERWSSFENFLADMGPRPSPRHTLERNENDGPYSPENCRWATRKEQANNKRNNARVVYNGETRTIAQWAERVGLRPMTLWFRLNRRHWPVDKALTSPLLLNQHGGARG